MNSTPQVSDITRSNDQNRRLLVKYVKLHVHNYAVEVVVRVDVDPATGYLLDLKRLSDLIGREVIADVDHRNLNTDVPWLTDRIPTAENLAVAFWGRLRPHLPDGSLQSVRVYETEKNWAECSDAEWARNPSDAA